jgi:RNA:NAD 2'-phosphotransferase (TPT1/KptA family)
MPIDWNVYNGYTQAARKGFPIENKSDPVVPAPQIPDVLYHGTLLKNIDSIKEHGLMGMSVRRPFVTLKKDIQEADLTAKRHVCDQDDVEQNVVIIKVAIDKFLKDGYHIEEKDYGFGTVWETVSVPTEYLEMLTL